MFVAGAYLNDITCLYVAQDGKKALDYAGKSGFEDELVTEYAPTPLPTLF